MNSLRLITGKEKGKWFAKLQVKMFDGYFEDVEERIESDSYSGIQIKIGEKCWIDQINKNPENDERDK